MCGSFKQHQHNFDQQRPAFSHKYGAQTIVQSHSCLNDPSWSSTFRQSYRMPTQRQKPTTASKAWGNEIVFDTKMNLATRGETKASGFVQNSTLFDGNGWVPKRNLHSDLQRTEYRNRYN